MSADNLQLPASNELTQAQFAALRGVKPPLVTRWKQAGRLVLTDDGKRVRVAESIARLDARRDPARGGDRSGKAVAATPSAPASPAGGGVDPAGGVPDGAKLVYTDEAAREKRARAQLAELELAKAAGELVRASDVDAVMFDMARAGREAVMSIADRLASILAAESDPVAVHAKLSAECRRVCELLAAPAAGGATQRVVAA